MITTTNYNLKMPSSSDVLNMDYINDDIMVIDDSLKDLDDKVKKHSSNISHIPYAVLTGSANSYEVTINPEPASYQDGMAVRVKINETSTGASTLNVNGLGAKAIKDCYGNDITGSGLKANTPYIMCYESVSQSFIVQGKGGGGNATADQILDGIKATVDSGPITGTMPNNGAVSEVLDINGTYTISKGYHDGNGKVTQSIPTKTSETYIPGTTDQIITAGQYLLGDQTIQGDADLITDNVKSGTSIFGIKGKDSVVDTADATAVEGEIIKGKTAYVNGAKVRGTMQDNEGIVIKPSTSDQPIPQGYHNGKGYVEGDTDLKPENIKAGVNIFGVEGKSSIVETSDGTATENEILDGYTAYVDGAKVTGVMPNNGAVANLLDINGSYTIPKGYHDGKGKVTQSIPTKSAATYTPGTSNQTIAAGNYLSGNQIIEGDADLITSNIKAGTNIFGVPGKDSVVDTADATAIDGNILIGKNAYINGKKIAGKMADNGALNTILPINGIYTIPAGYTTGGQVTQKIPVASPDYGDQMLANNRSCGPYSGDGKNYAYLGVPNGSYLNGVNWIRSLEKDLLEKNIVDQKTIFGITGKATIDSLGGKRFASGTLDIVAEYQTWTSHGRKKSGYNSLYLPPNTLPFTPKLLIFNFNEKNTPLPSAYQSRKSTVYNMDMGIIIGAIGGWQEVNGGTSDSVTTISLYNAVECNSIDIASRIAITKGDSDHAMVSGGTTYTVSWFAYM
jgi:hypothetical protein